MSTKDALPVWNDKYAKMGVSARELYMRQQGLCWLKAEVLPDNTVQVMCTDGDETALTQSMLNPTIECAKCMSCFVAKVVESSLES